MSRNARRTQAADTQEEQKTGNITHQPGNLRGILDTIVATEIVDLPSQGIFYTQNSTLNGRTSIEIKQMTAKEEDILTSRSLLAQGVVIERLLKSLIVDPAVNVDDLLVCDQNALLVAARKTGYGASYPVNITCEACGHNNEVEYSLDTVGMKPPADSEPNAEVSYEFINGACHFELPKTGIRVAIRPLTLGAEKKVEEERKRREKLKLAENTLTSFLNSIVIEANGDNNRALIKELISLLPAQDSRWIRKVYNLAMPSTETKIDFTCQKCNHNAASEVPFSASFFWPDP